MDKRRVAESNPPGSYQRQYVLGRGKTGGSSTPKLEEVCAHALSTLEDKRLDWTTRSLSGTATSVGTGRAPLFTVGRKTLR